jgi:MtN3 and saliva related transmembrane protein
VGLRDELVHSEGRRVNADVVERRKKYGFAGIFFSIRVDAKRLRSMMAAETVGYVAGSLTTIAFIPQAWLSWKTRHTAGLSLGMYSIFAVGVALWLAYGVLIGAWPVILSNLITLALALFILVIRLRHGPGT